MDGIAPASERPRERRLLEQVNGHRYFLQLCEAATWAERKPAADHRNEARRYQRNIRRAQLIYCLYTAAIDPASRSPAAHRSRRRSRPNRKPEVRAVSHCEYLVGTDGKKGLAMAMWSALIAMLLSHFATVTAAATRFHSPRSSQEWRSLPLQPPPKRRTTIAQWRVGQKTLPACQLACRHMGSLATFPPMDSCRGG